MMTIGALIVSDWAVRPPPVAAAREGARVGLLIGAGVALWVAARVLLGGANGPDVRLIRAALSWAAESTATGEPTPLWLKTAAPIAWGGALHLGSAAAFGAAIATLVALVRFNTRAVCLLGVVAAELGAWQLAGGHAGPWLRALIWYHLVTAALTVLVVLEQRSARMARAARDAPRWENRAAGTDRWTLHHAALGAVRMRRHRPIGGASDRPTRGRLSVAPDAP